MTLRLLHAVWSRLPRSWRARAPNRLRRSWQRTQRRHKDLPVRLIFPDAATAGGRKVRVVIFGEFADDWLPAFVNPEIWTRIEGVTEVLRVADEARPRLPKPAVAGSGTVVVPLSIANIRNCPRGHAALIPDAAALETLGNKRKFADYVAAQGLGHLCPTTFASDEEAEFPCILKRTDLAAAWGIAVAHSPAELARLRGKGDWRDKECIVQAFVPAAVEYVTHCVCRDGRILWSCSFACTKQHAEQVRAGMDHQRIEPAAASARALDQIGRVLKPLGFSGPCSVDYRLSPDGDVVIFEVNPRFGGTLTMPEHADRLAEALACIIEHARALPRPDAATASPAGA
jgi:carbamoylphosphate synthase large subunit